MEDIVLFLVKGAKEAMSALLLKDYYVIFRQMKIFLLLILVFSCHPRHVLQHLCRGVCLYAALHRPGL